MTTRRQLSLFVPVAEGTSLERLRRELDPVQAALIPAHVTLCREDEIDKLSISEIAGRLQRSAAKPLTLGFGLPVTFQGHGVLLPCVNGEREFRNLRTLFLGAAVIRQHVPHITLAHPRNPASTKRTLSDLVGLPLSYTFVAITYIEQVGAARWRVLQEFNLA